MKLFALLFLALNAFSTKGICLPYAKVVFTDVVFVRQTSTNVNETTFPLYFNHKAFIADVLSDISKYTKEVFKVPEVEFLLPDSIQYLSSWELPKLKLKQKAKKMGGKQKLFGSVETILSEGFTINGVLTYKLTTKVTLYNGKGQLYYKFKSIIPFETYAGEDIAGKTQIGDIDFYTFYFDGLQLAFEGKTKRAEHRYVARPAADYYQRFFNDAEKFYLGFNGKNYVYGSDEKT